jgi:hypothetical protein
VAITEHPTLGESNLVVNPDQPFDVEVAWHVFGNLVPLWLTALSVNTSDWVGTYKIVVTTFLDSALRGGGLRHAMGGG